MIEAPTDPVQDLIDKAKHLGKRIALQLMDENHIISVEDSGEKNSLQRRYVAYISKLPSEPKPFRPVITIMAFLLASRPAVRRSKNR